MLDLVSFFLYPAPSIPLPQEPPRGLEEVTIESEGCKKVEIWIANSRKEGAMVVWFHGNGENLLTVYESGLFSRFEEITEIFAVVEYPGYGREKCTTNEESIVESAIKATVTLKDKYEPNILIVAGWSLGAAVAAQVAKEVKVDGIVLISPWSSLKDLAKLHYPAILVNLFVSNNSYNTKKVLSSLEIPTLIIHGNKDKIIPIEQGIELFRNAAGKTKKFVQLPSYHNTTLGEEQLWKEIKEFVFLITNSKYK